METRYPYIVEVEHQVSQNGITVDANVSYVRRVGPDCREALEYFHKEIDNSYTNIHGVTNTVVVRNVYRRVY